MVGQLRDMSEYTENSGRKAVKTVLQYVTRTCDVPRYSISRFFVCLSVCLSVVCLSVLRFSSPYNAENHGY